MQQSPTPSAAKESSCVAFQGNEHFLVFLSGLVFLDLLKAVAGRWCADYTDCIQFNRPVSLGIWIPSSVPGQLWHLILAKCRLFLSRNFARQPDMLFRNTSSCSSECTKSGL